MRKQHPPKVDLVMLTPLKLILGGITNGS